MRPRGSSFSVLSPPTPGAQPNARVCTKPHQRPRISLQLHSFRIVLPFAFLATFRLVQLITADSDGFCKLWDLRTFSCLETFTSSVAEESRANNAKKSRKALSCALPTRVRATSTNRICSQRSDSHATERRDRPVIRPMSGAAHVVLIFEASACSSSREFLVKVAQFSGAPDIVSATF